MKVFFNVSTIKQQSSFIVKLLLLISLLTSINVKAHLDDLEFDSPLEQSAALANQRVYEQLLELGCTDDTQSGGQNSPECTGKIFEIFSNVRELIHTANALSRNGGPTRYSLGLDQESLGFALRWTAAEEYSALGGMSSEFASGQLNGLTSRLKTLRSGISGFSVLGSNSYSEQFADNRRGNRASGGGASADQIGNFNRWSGFINATYGAGDREATTLEDAFDFDGNKIAMGVDYRLDNNWVLGVVAGYSDQEVDFDSSQSIVDGGILSDGYSLMPFVMYQSGPFYSSLSIGSQKQSFEMTRFIKYASLNPDVEGVNTYTESKTDASIISTFIEVGYSYNYEALVVEPFASYSKQDTKVDAFVERDVNDEAFDLAIDKQNIDSQEFAAGIKFQYAFTPNWGVIIPFIDLQFHKQLETDSRNISSQYSSLPNSFLADSGFNLATDKLDDSYYSYSIGINTVISGSTSVNDAGEVSGGLQAFVNYKSIEELEYFTEKLITLGLRYEF